MRFDSEMGHGRAAARTKDSRRKKSRHERANQMSLGGARRAGGARRGAPGVALRRVIAFAATDCEAYAAAAFSLAVAVA